MSDKKNSGGAFSSYSSSTIKPKNLTSDMWTPITSSGNYTAYTPVENKFKSPEKSSQSAEKARGEAAKQRDIQKENPRAKTFSRESSADAKAKNKAKAVKKNTAQKSKAAQSDRPISGGRVPERKKAKASAAKNKSNTKANKQPGRISKNVAELRRKSADRTFVRLISGGKTADEARLIVTKRKIRKKKLRTFGSVFFLFFFASLFVFSYCYFEGAPVDKIIIEGDEVYTNQEIIDAAKLSEGVNMLTVREKAVNENVTKVLPFVSSVGLDYMLPDTLKLNVISTKERMIIKNGSSYICVDKTGKVVSDKKKKLSEGQFLIQGMKQQDYTVGEMFVPSEENAEKFEIVYKLTSAAEGYEKLNYGVIDVSDTQDITLTYRSKIRIYFGNAENLESKIADAEEVMALNDTENKTGYINLKYAIGAYFMEGSLEA